MRRKIVGILFALVLVASLGLVIVPPAKVGAATNTQTFTVSGTFVVPERVTKITVATWGGGGAGGGSTDAGFLTARGGAGGGGGAYASSILTVAPGQTLQVVVGAGGTGVSGASGNAGSPSFGGPDVNPNNALVRAAGGSGGTGNTAGGTPAGGAGGTVGNSIGQTRIAGSNGGDGDTGYGISSGAGGAGANGGGSGGAAISSGTSNGNPGSVYGGGGGGARTSQNEGARTGGAGAAGKVVITWVTYNLTISSTAGGSVTEPGQGTFTCGEQTVVNLVATPASGYRFVNWTGNVSTIGNVTAAATNITMNGNYSITANFTKVYDLTISSTAGGSVTTPGEGVFTYDTGTVVNLVATPTAGYRFVNWTGNVSTIGNVTAASTNITMSGDYSITANFIKVYDLTVSSTAGGSVTTPGEGVFTYDTGTVVNLVATPGAGYWFVEWTGDVDTIANVNTAATNITMNGDYSITANFDNVPPIQYYLAISSTSGGSVTEPGEGVFTYNKGRMVGLVAAPDVGYRFDRWTGDVDTIVDVESMAITIPVNDSYSITAKFMAVGWYSIFNPIAGGGCFIATAAYGTPMAEEIQILREFRDKYLLTNPVGRLFVAFYYRGSPPIAEFITEHTSLKPIVRAGLAPAVAMSTVAVNTTPAEKMAIVGLLALVSVALAVWATRRRGKGVEYS